MKAIGYSANGPASADTSVVEFETATPQPGPTDLLIEVRGVSTNPVDYKVRANRPPGDGEPSIVGYDGAGIVQEIGPDCTRFKVGDEVFWAGDIGRPGSNAEFQLVDERIVGRKPKTLDFAEASGLPLTTITAWELLFDSFGLSVGGGNGEKDGAGDALLVIGGAGGVGSILIQLAKKLTSLEVIATASRPETDAWVRRMGADHVVDHTKPLDAEVAGLGIAPRYVAALTHTNLHYEAIVELIKPRGHIGMIDDPGPIELGAIKFKALSFSWEFMFTRSMFQTDDMDAQHQLLNRTAELIDDGTLISTMNEHFGPLNGANLQRALVLQESGSAIGKTVLDGFS